MNYKRIEAIAETMENYAKILRQSAQGEWIDDEALDGIARAIERLEKNGVVVERKE